MKHILCVAFLSSALPVFLFAADTDASHGSAIDRNVHSQDDNNKRRGRGHGRDDSNRHNGNRNSNNSNSNSSNANRSGSQISSVKARVIALRAVPGTIVKGEFEEKNGRSIYEFYVRKNSGETFEVYVDAETGDIVKNERKSMR
jgi:uncharacterized membrane protein YkoI